MSLCTRLFNPGRRAALAGLISLGIALLRPRRLLAGEDLASRALAFEELIRGLTGGQGPVASSALELKVPALAEDGSMVPVSLSGGPLPVESLALLARENPNPLLAQFVFYPGARPIVALRVKLQRSGALQLLAVTKDRVYDTKTHVEVAQGGCG